MSCFSHDAGELQMSFIMAACVQIACMNATYAFFAPFFPLVAPGLHLTLDDVAWIFGIKAAAEFFASPLAGPIASRFGRRRES